MWVNTVKENCMYKKDKKINQKSLKSFPVLWMSYPAEQNRIWLLATLEKNWNKKLDQFRRDALENGNRM